MWSKYNIIDTFEKIEALDAFLINSENKPNFEVLSVDTETNGLRHYLDVIIGVSISTDSHSGFYIPLLYWEPNKDSLKTRKIDKISVQSYMQGHLRNVWNPAEIYPENVTSKEFQVPEFIKLYLERWLTSGSLIIMHNAVFDLSMIKVNLNLDLSNFVYCDTMLLHHVLDENNSHGLKEIAIIWKDKLGIDPKTEADQERMELGASIIGNGGTFNTRTKHVWRADHEILGKYAISDTFLTMKVFEYGITQLEPKLYDWFFEEEVMPLCKEVLFPMKLQGVPINVEYFQTQQIDVGQELDKIEDEFMQILEKNNFLEGFELGKSLTEGVPKSKFINKIMELEELEHPTIIVKGELKKSLNKKALEKAKEENPHWLWDFLTGDGEIRYTEARQEEILKELYYVKNNRRYRFNINSDMHLIWLFCDKLGHPKDKLPQTKSATPANPIPSMAGEVLEEVFLPKYHWVSLLLKYKKIHKLWSTYITGILERQHEGVLYPSFLQHGTVSGRFASRDPNLQNLPRVEDLSSCEKCESKNVLVEKLCSVLADIKCKNCGHIQKDKILSSVIKKGFIAPKGYKLINADYPSLEPKIFSFMSGSPKLKELWEKGEDLYSRMYIDILGANQYSANPKAENSLKKQNPEERARIKPACLGVPYGMKAGQLANAMNFKTKYITRDGYEVETLDFGAGQEFIDRYLKAYPELADYMLCRENEAKTRGWVETIIGRKRNFLYAPYIFRLLMDMRVDIEKFLTMPKKALDKIDLEGELTRDVLYDFCDKFGIETWKVGKREFTWYNIKHLLKHDLDQAKNHPIQGLAAHITNRAMIEIARKLKKEGLNGWLILQVHDEITGLVKEEDAQAAITIWKEGMGKNLYAEKVGIDLTPEPIVCDTLDEGK